MENRIKEQQFALLADRTSCHAFPANQFRVLLSAAAYVLVETLRRTALKKTELEAAQAGTIRLKRFKVAARVITSVRRRVLHLSSAYPLTDLFARVLARLRAAARHSPPPRSRRPRHNPFGAGGKGIVCTDCCTTRGMGRFRNVLRIYPQNHLLLMKYAGWRAAHRVSNRIGMHQVPIP